jgi:mitogen-activated protein kinase 15
LTAEELEQLEPDYIEPRMIAKYELICQVGRGSYGVVWRAIEKKNREVVAIKKIYDAFSNEIDAKRTFREVFFLAELNDHPNIMKINRIRKSKNGRDIYIVAEFIECDLHSVIRANICDEVQI